MLDGGAEGQGSALALVATRMASVITQLFVSTLQNHATDDINVGIRVRPLSRI